MSDRRACPQAQVLAECTSGQRSLAEIEAVADHVEACPACAQLVEQLLAEDSLVETLVGSNLAAQLPVDARAVHIMAQLRKQTSGEPRADSVAAASHETSADVRPDRATVPVAELAQEVRETLARMSPAQNPDELGRLGPYRVLRVLGKGGMGEVFLAEDTHLGRTVALKVMRNRLAGNRHAQERFLREARAMAALKHPHIITIYHVGEENDLAYLAMEYLEGRSLADHLREHPQLTAAECISLGTQIAQGLAAAHAKGMIHRDIKPDNIWLEPANDDRAQPYHVKILDFGLARAVTVEENGDSPLTETGMILGTPAYMAPEQAAGSVEARSDLFSLGCVLYRAATGKVPFHGSNVLSTLMAITSDEPLPPSTINADLGDDLSALILELLGKDPVRRPSSAAEVVRRLQRISHPQPEPARSSQRKWWLASGLVAALVLVLAGIVVIVRDKDGNKVAEITVPKDGKIEIQETNKDKKPPVAPTNRDRAVAEWIVSVGGDAGVANAQGFTVCRRGDTLPDTFRLETTGLQGVENVNDQDLARFDKLPSLKVLTVGDCQVTDDGLARLGELPALEAFYFFGKPVGNRGLAELARYRKLTDLKVHGGRITDEGLAPLLELKHLQILQLDYSRIGNTGLKTLSRLGTLKKLWLRGAQIDDKGVQHLCAMTQLTFLDVSNTKISSSGLAELRKSLPGCRILPLAEEPQRAVAEWAISVGGLVFTSKTKDDAWELHDRERPLPEGPICLHQVDLLHSDQVRDEDLARFDQLPYLENLMLMDVPVTDRGLALLGELPKLRSLYFDKVKISSTGLAAITRYKSLVNLQVHGGISHEGVEQVAQLSNLKDLRLHFAGLGNKSLAPLVSLKQLERLYLSGWKIDNDAISHLREMKKLELVDLTKTDVDEIGYAELKKALPKCVILPFDTLDKERAVAEWTLLVGGYVLASAPGLKPWDFYTSIRSLPEGPFELNSVDLGRSRVVRPEDMERLDDLPNLGVLVMPAADPKLVDAMLAHVGKLPALRALYNLHASDEGLKQLARFPSLRVVHVHGEPLTLEGIKTLAKLDRLEELNVAFCPVGDEAVVHLKRLKKMKRLDIGASPITDACIQHLSEMKHLEMLVVVGTKLTPEGLDRLKKALPDCTIKTQQ